MTDPYKRLRTAVRKTLPNVDVGSLWNDIAALLSSHDAQAAEIERLREALSKIIEIDDKYSGGDLDEIEEARGIASAALAQGEQP